MTKILAWNFDGTRSNAVRKFERPVSAVDIMNRILAKGGKLVALHACEDISIVVMECRGWQFSITS
jgi:hypothetical protein